MFSGGKRQQSNALVNQPRGFNVSLETWYDRLGHPNIPLVKSALHKHGIVVVTIVQVARGLLLLIIMLTIPFLLMLFNFVSTVNCSNPTNCHFWLHMLKLYQLLLYCI